MEADRHYYTAESANGDRVVDPSEDGLWMRVAELALPGNQNVVIEPIDPGLRWYVVVALLEDGTYEVEYHDPRRREHEIVRETDRNRLCREVTIWLANLGPLQDSRAGENGVGS